MCEAGPGGYTAHRMVRIIHRRGDGVVDSTLGVEAIPGALEDAAGVLWVDFLDEPDDSCERILRDVCQADHFEARCGPIGQERANCGQRFCNRFALACAKRA